MDWGSVNGLTLIRMKGVTWRWLVLRARARWRWPGGRILMWRWMSRAGPTIAAMGFVSLSRRVWRSGNPRMDSRSSFWGRGITWRWQRLIDELPAIRVGWSLGTKS